MMSLTTVQRDLLQQLLAAEGPIGAVALGERLHVTSRQVLYGLRDIKAWLEVRDVQLRHVPGVGVQIAGSPEQRRQLVRELASHSRFQLVLTPDQRQQLLALHLLAATAPSTLGQFQEDFASARVTMLKDLDALEPWLQRFRLTLARRQRRGFWIEGAEQERRQALAALLWGDVPFEWPIAVLIPGQGIRFALAQDEALLPIVAQANALVRRWDVAAAQATVIQAEAELGGRFSDVAIDQLALVGAVQQQRISVMQFVRWPADALHWAQAQAVWPVAAGLAERLWPALPADVRANEAAALALQLAAGARDEPWRHDLPADAALRSLIDTMLEHIADTYQVPELARDRLLRDGLDAYILPACVRQRFGLWWPPNSAPDIQGERQPAERAVAARLADDVLAATGLTLPADAFNDLILLVRAALVRARSERMRRVLVVCPSGMATTQLLVARLRARFPRLGTFEVLPMRELTPARLVDADLIISTVPLTLPPGTSIDVIQVHPMLQTNDIVALTRWMA